MVKSMKVPTGYVLQESDYPEVPPKLGQLGRWKRYTDPIVQDITIHAEYGNPIPGTPTNPPSLMSTGEEPYSSGTAQPISTVTEEHNYIYASGMLLRETITSGSTTKTLDFRYDNVGYPYALIYNNGSTTATYYYITNLQGDVMYLVDGNGIQVAAYTYDPYGKILSAYGSMAEINPLRYRGYYYDAETGFYYLQSRYYDPNTCRFINADSYASTGQSYLGYNMFAYCGNNPVERTDADGEFWDLIFDVVSLVTSVVDVIQNPDDPLAWAGLVGDIVDVAVPFVAGVGEATKAIGAVADAADAIDDAYDATKTIKRADNIIGYTGSASDARRAVKDLDLDGGCTGGYCFVAGTLVLTGEGNQVIEDVEIGDYVWAANPETGELELKQVIQLFRNEAEELTHVFVRGEEIVCTPGHPFYSPQYGWVDACELETGDILVLPGGDYVFVERTYTEQLEEPVAIYNFEVQDFHTYFVGKCNVLVHNKNCEFTKYSEDEIARYLDTSVEDFHRNVKPKILKEARQELSRGQLNQLGRNPDILLRKNRWGNCISINNKKWKENQLPNNKKYMGNVKLE